MLGHGGIHQNYMDVLGFEVLSRFNAMPVLRLLGDGETQIELVMNTESKTP